MDILQKYWLFIILSYLAEVLGTISGFGSSILFVPIASLFFDIKAVLGITALFHVFSNISKIFLFKEKTDKTIILYLGTFAVVFVSIGAYLSGMIQSYYIEIILSFFIIIIAIIFLIYPNIELPKTKKILALSGVLSGFLAGLVGTGGAIRGLTLSAFNLPKAQFISTSALIDLGVDSSRAIVYWWNGFMDKNTFILIPILILISSLGSWSGKIILQYISESYFKKIVLSIIFLTGFIQLGKLIF